MSAVLCLLCFAVGLVKDLFFSPQITNVWFRWFSLSFSCSLIYFFLFVIISLACFEFSLLFSFLGHLVFIPYISHLVLFLCSFTDFFRIKCLLVHNIIHSVILFQLQYFYLIFGDVFCLWLFVCSDFNLGGFVFLNCFLIDLRIGIYILVYALVAFSLL